MNEELYYLNEEREENQTTQSAYSCCISFLCLLCGFILLQTNQIIENKPQNYYYQCTLTMPITYFCGIAFFLAGILRFIILVVFCFQSQKSIPHFSLFHKKIKHAEVMIAMGFFFFGSFILMVKEQCYELTVALLFVLILTAFMILQVCCYDMEEDDLIGDEIFDY